MTGLPRPWAAFGVILVALLLGPILFGSGGAGLDGAHLAAATGRPHAPEVAPSLARFGVAAPLGTGRNAASTPSNCSQGAHSLEVAPSAGNMEPALLSAFDELGEEGGGTLQLSAGTYVLDQTLTFMKYSNVSIQGAGIGRTILTLPPDPVGNFTAGNGTPVGQYNLTLGGPTTGTTANFIDVAGQPIDNFEMCALTIRAEANNATNDWAGSLIVDSSGGYHHSYTDLAEVGFFGPSTVPNGIHLEGNPGFNTPGTGYVVDNLQASNNTVPFENYPGYKGGPNFLNIAGLVNCTLDDVTGIGMVEFDDAPTRGCSMENWTLAGHILIDPLGGGSWGNTLFENVTVNSTGTAAPNALQSSVPDGDGGGSSNFSALRWVNDTFDGAVADGANLVDVENSTFNGGLDQTPAVFERNTVNWTDGSPQRLLLPIQVEGAPAGGLTSVLDGNTFVFPNGTDRKDPFQLVAPQVSWSNDTIAVLGSTSGYLFSAPDLVLSASSDFSSLTYRSLGNTSPAALVLFDIVGSPGFVDLGASVSGLVGIYDDLPQYAPSVPTGLEALSSNETAVTLAWNSSSGPVTNYTVLAGTNLSSYSLAFSAGLRTAFSVQGLAPGTRYFFAVQAWNGSRPSAASSPVPFSTRPVPQYAPLCPTGLTIVELGATTVELGWTPSVGNVTNYTVLVGTDPTAMNVRYSVGATPEFTVRGLLAQTKYFVAVQAWNYSWASNRTEPLTVTTLPTAPPPPPGLLFSLGQAAVLSGTAAGIFVAIAGPIALAGYARARGQRARTWIGSEPDD